MTQSTITYPTQLVESGEATPVQAHNATDSASESTGLAFAVTSFVLGLVSVTTGALLVAPLLGLTFGIMAKNRGTQHTALANWGIGLSVVMLALVLVFLMLGLITFTMVGLAIIPGLGV